MKLNLSNLDFSKNDLKLNIKVPRYLDNKLAYLLGVQIGDGYLKKIVREGRVDYLISYDGHLINEFDWYNYMLKELIKDLFNKDVQVRKVTRGTVKIYFRSKAIFMFLHKVCAISQSPKNNIVVPRIILDSSREIKRSFLRGLADTDFSLTFKNRKNLSYPVIYFQTNSKSLHKSIANLLKELGFKIHCGYRKNKRYDKYYDSCYINISGRDQLDKWLKEIGFESSNHMTRYQVWKKLGHLPPNTNIGKDTGY